jgi:5'-3' exoribonuclease 2
MHFHNDPLWENIVVLLSDTSVPGSGKQKIIDFIRRQRTQPKYDPNTKHAICGTSPSELILLGLATHELNFFVIVAEEFLSSMSSDQISK